MRVQPSRVLAHGITAGCLAYLVIVVAYAALNVIDGRSMFATAALLGHLLIGSDIAATDAAAVIAFNGAHLVAAIAAGMILSWLISEWEIHPTAGYFFFFVLLAGFVAGAFGSAVLLSEIAGAVSWTTIMVVDALAAASMAAFLFALHPQLRRDFFLMTEA
jgi:hypothetical protein